LEEYGVGFTNKVLPDAIESPLPERFEHVALVEAFDTRHLVGVELLEAIL
jgi:hypothetical protein